MTSPVVETGYSLAGVTGVLDGINEIPVTHSTFWHVMTFFLHEQNRVFSRKLKQERDRRSRKTGG